MSVRLFVGNLPYDVTETELREFFTPVGRLSRVFLPVDRETGKQRGFAFIELGSQSEADDAIQRLNQQSFKGRPIAVKEARERENRGPAPPRGNGFGPRPPSAGFSSSRPPMSRPPARPGGGAPSATASLDELAPQKRRNRNFGPPARPDRKRRLQNKPHKSEWGKKAFLRSRLDEDDDFELEVNKNFEEEPRELQAGVEELDAAGVEELDDTDVEELDDTDVEELDDTDAEELDDTDVEELDDTDVEEVDDEDVEELDDERE
jgi:RNA recognition motif-containing protein